MRTRHFAFALALCLGGLTGCSSSIEIGSDDGGIAGDTGSMPVDANTGEPCGANTCRDGEYCCNASCGICAPEGAGCIAVECTEPVVCNGVTCEGDGATCCAGCRPGESHCSAPNGECPPIACPTDCLSDADCGSGGRCCGGCVPGELGVCVGEMESCPDLFCGEPCGDTTCGMGEQCCPAGCPGMSDFCSTADTMCPIPDCPAPSCDPFQAWGSGPCDALLGVRWNGYYCETISGCDCVGVDCGRLYGTQAECESFHSGVCPGTPGCTADLDCPDSMYCNGCAHGSCLACLDCVADCVPNPCGSEPEPACDGPRPECGEGGVAIVKDGCWVCVDPYSCDPLEATDCRVAGCPGDETCQPCWATHQCLPPGAVC